MTRHLLICLERKLFQGIEEEEEKEEKINNSILDDFDDINVSAANIDGVMDEYHKMVYRVKKKNEFRNK